MAVSDKEMKELLRLTSDVRSARKNLERAMKAKSAINAEMNRLLDENISGTDPETRAKNGERISTLQDQYRQINEGTFVYPKDGPDFGRHIYRWGAFLAFRKMMVLLAWAIVALLAWIIFF